MDRAEKRAWVASMKDALSAVPVVVVTHYKGLTVAEMSELRQRMREAGGHFKVTKNRLTKLALEGRVLGEAGVKALADLPSLDELRAKLAGLLQTPAQRVAGVLQAPAGQLARVLKARAEAA